MDRIKIIIDTDIGDDADDALAICLALKSEELEVMGITTVFRNTAARAQIAVRLLQLMGRTDIPVYAGIGHPLVAEADVETVPIQLLAGMEELEYQKRGNRCPGAGPQCAGRVCICKIQVQGQACAVSYGYTYHDDTL